MVDVSNIGKGLVADPIDARDFKAEAIMGAVLLPAEYEVLQGINLPVEGQGSSSSCTGQAGHKYAEVLDFIENNKVPDLSAKSLYSQIYLPQGGAYLRDVMKLIVSFGVALESDVPSYIAGVNGRMEVPTEPFMRDTAFLANQQIVARAKTYRAKSYAMVESKSFDFIKQAIYQNTGCLVGFNGDNAGWNNAIIKPPVSVEWGHAVYAKGWKFINGKEYLIIQNSWGKDWGDNGIGYIGRDYFQNLDNVLNPWTILDNPNQEKMKFIRQPGGKNVYQIVDGVRYHVSGPTSLMHLQNASGVPITEEDIYKYKYGGRIMADNADDPK